MDFETDVKFVPITLNYDRVHEGESFPDELLGEKMTKDDLMKVLKKLTFLNVKCGRVHIKYGEPISL